MQGIAKRRAGLDAEEAHWLREADRCQIWRELGMVSAADYMERVLGYAPHTANERLRTANALGASGRAKFQIALTVCKRCQQGWQEGAGVQVAVDASTVARARCDAQEIGSLDGPEPERAHQDVAPSVMRLVWRRDGGCCRVPGCRSSRCLEAHRASCSKEEPMT